MKQLTLEELHSVLLDIGKEFHRICVKHGIPYLMVGGTMLGAVRHKGFIPWDDDMDFGVPREHFKTLQNLLESELCSPLRLLTMDNSEALLNGFIKIEDTRTVVKELWKEDIATQTGVNIDIFPLDRCNGGKGKCSKNFMIQTLLRVQGYRFLFAGNRPLPKKILAYMLKALLFPMNKKSVITYIEKHLMTDGDYVTNHYGAWGCREIMPSSVFAKRVLYDFENTQLYGVQDFDLYLKNLYGDYMKLPPEGQRHIHLLNTCWK